MPNINKATNILRDIKEELDTAINCLSDGTNVEEKVARPSAIPESFANIVPEANSQENPPVLSSIRPTAAPNTTNMPQNTSSATTSSNLNNNPTPATAPNKPSFAKNIVNELASKTIPNATGDIATKLIDTFNSIKEKITPDDVKAAAEKNAPAPISNTPISQTTVTPATPAAPTPVAPAPVAPATPVSTPAVLPTTPPPVVPKTTVEPTFAPADTNKPIPTPAPVEPNPNTSFNVLHDILGQDTSLPSQKPADLPVSTPSDDDNSEC